MTREEAIEVIKQDIPCEHDTDLIEALEMAIQALVIIDKIEPMFGDMLDIPTQELMRDATPEERESIDKYIKSISKPTGIEFDKEQEPETGHCEDCKHFRKLPYHADILGKCVNHWGFCPKGDWYCADFEPQESER